MLTFFSFQVVSEKASYHFGRLCLCHWVNRAWTNVSQLAVNVNSQDYDQQFCIWSLFDLNCNLTKFHPICSLHPVKGGMNLKALGNHLKMWCKIYLSPRLKVVYTLHSVHALPSQSWSTGYQPFPMCLRLRHFNFIWYRCCYNNAHFWYFVFRHLQCSLSGII